MPSDKTLEKVTAAFQAIVDSRTKAATAQALLAEIISELGASAPAMLLNNKKKQAANRPARRANQIPAQREPVRPANAKTPENKTLANSHPLPGIRSTN